MKNFVFKIFLFALLLGATQHFYGHNPNRISFSKKEKSHQIKSGGDSADQIDLTEFDLEEDHYAGDEHHEISQSDYTSIPVSIDHWLQCLAVLWKEADTNQLQDYHPHIGFTTPIYITHRVLRI